MKSIFVKIWRKKCRIKILIFTEKRPVFFSNNFTKILHELIQEPFWFHEIFFRTKNKTKMFVLVSRNFLQIRHSVEKCEILSHRKNISWNQLFSNLFSKTIAFTKFLSKKYERQFSHCELQCVEKSKLCTSFWKASF